MLPKKAVVITACCLIPVAAGYIVHLKNSSALHSKNTAIQSLEAECAALQAELSEMKATLTAQGKETPDRMKVLLDQIEALQKDNDRFLKMMSKNQGTPESGTTAPSPNEIALEKDSAAAPADQASAASDRRQIARLQEENQRLQTELESLKAQLTQKAAAEIASALPEGAPAFRNTELLSAYRDVLTSTSKVRTLDLLVSLSGYSAQQEMELIPIIQQAMAGGDPEVCRTALELLEPYENAAILPLLEQGFGMADEDTRLAALAPLAKLNDPGAVELMGLAMNDAVEAVRSRVMEVAEQQTGDTQLASLAKGLTSAYQETQSQALSLLELRGDKAVIDVVLLGLETSNPEFKQEVNSALQFLVDREFETYQQGIQWWQANKNRYDDDLIEIKQADQ